MKKVYEAFGPRPPQGGADWPISGNNFTYGFFTAEDKDWVLGKTIERLWPFAEGA